MGYGGGSGGGTGAVASVFGRTGDVVAESGDYTPEQVGADAAGAADAVQTALDAHEALTNNPHAVTAVQAGADPSGSAATVQGNLDTHAARTDNPHAVTAAQVGALAAATTAAKGSTAGPVFNTTGPILWTDYTISFDMQSSADDQSGKVIADVDCRKRLICITLLSSTTTNRTFEGGFAPHAGSSWMAQTGPAYYLITLDPSAFQVALTWNRENTSFVQVGLNADGKPVLDSFYQGPDGSAWVVRLQIGPNVID